MVAPQKEAGDDFLGTGRNKAAGEWVDDLHLRRPPAWLARRVAHGWFRRRAAPTPGRRPAPCPRPPTDSRPPPRSFRPARSGTARRSFGILGDMNQGADGCVEQVRPKHVQRNPGEPRDRRDTFSRNAAGPAPPRDRRVIDADCPGQFGRTASGPDSGINHARRLAFPTIPRQARVGGTNAGIFQMCLSPFMGTGNIVRVLRKERRLTQEELAAELGWARGTIAAIESGHHKPGRDLVAALATFFGVTTDAILVRDRESTDSTRAEDDGERELLARYRVASPEGKEAVLMSLRALTR